MELPKSYPTAEQDADSIMRLLAVNSSVFRTHLIEAFHLIYRQGTLDGATQALDGLVQRLENKGARL